MPGHKVALPHRHPAFLAFDLAAEDKELLTDGVGVSIARGLSEGTEISGSEGCKGGLSVSTGSVLTTGYV